MLETVTVTQPAAPVTEVPVTTEPSVGDKQSQFVEELVMGGFDTTLVIDEASMAALGRSVCDAFDRGVTEDQLRSMPDSEYTPTDMDAVFAASKTVYCPEYN